MTHDEKKQTDTIAALIQAVATLDETFARTQDVTLHEFQQISQARDDLADLVRRMYESVIYKDD
ncbi:MAG TPA: hypothetical protein VIL72_01830 [Beijerinckiaceae bacterium]